MEMKELLQAANEKMVNLKLRGSKENPVLRYLDKIIHNNLKLKMTLYRVNSFYKKDEDSGIEFASVKMANKRYLAVRKFVTVNKKETPDVTLYEFGSNPNPLIPILAVIDDTVYDVYDCDNQCIREFINDVFRFIKVLTINDMATTVQNLKSVNDIIDVIDEIEIKIDENFDSILIFGSEPLASIKDIKILQKEFIKEDKMTEVTKEDIQVAAESLAHDIMVANEEIKPNSIPIKEVEEEPTAPVDVFEEPVPIFDHERDVRKMTEKVKSKNLKKEFWDEKLVFPIKNKKFFELLNRIYDDLRKKIISGHYALSTNDGGETFNWEKMDNFGEYIGFLFNDNMNVSIYADKSDASKYLKMDVYQTSKDLNIAANLFTVYFNLSNKYFYYEGRGYEAQFNFLSTIMHPALIFFYSDTQIMSNLFRIIFHEYGFDHVIDNAEEVYKKQKIADKARKAIKKEEERRKKAEKKKEKKAAKKEKESKEEKK